MKCIFKIQPVIERQVREIVPDSGGEVGRAVSGPQFQDSFLTGQLSARNPNKEMNHACVTPVLAKELD